MVGIALMACCSMVPAQVASKEPSHWKSGSPIFTSVGFKLDHGLQDAVRREILDTNTVGFIAESVGLTPHERKLFLVAPGPVEEQVWLYTLGEEWTEGCNRFGERLNAYALARTDGHTRACLLAGLTNRPALASISNPDLRILSTNYQLLPVWLFHREETGTRTNKAGQMTGRSTTAIIVDGKLQVRTNNTHIPRIDEVCRWASYTLVDGDIAWRYVLSFAVDGTLDWIHASKFDAKELDPRFRRVVEEVNAEVTAEMRGKGSVGRLGSVHTYWRLKKEKLKARGIDWYSPAELNPDSIYD
jgi:hypothetical protein